MSEETKAQSTGSAGFAFGLVVGCLIGAAAAILMTPQTGEATREELAQKVRRLKAEAIPSHGNGSARS